MYNKLFLVLVVAWNALLVVMNDTDSFSSTFPRLLMVYLFLTNFITLTYSTPSRIDTPNTFRIFYTHTFNRHIYLKDIHLKDIHLKDIHLKDIHLKGDVMYITSPFKLKNISFIHSN